MTEFAPRRVGLTHHFEIRRNRRGLWTASDSDGLAGGTFFSRKAAFRFALFESGGDAAHIDEPQERRHRGRP
jgi:hypothetical protein